jgi:hypothetical protein
MVYTEYFAPFAAHYRNFPFTCKVALADVVDQLLYYSVCHPESSPNISIDQPKIRPLAKIIDYTEFLIMEANIIFFDILLCSQKGTKIKESVYGIIYVQYIVLCSAQCCGHESIVFLSGSGPIFL